MEKTATDLENAGFTEAAQRLRDDMATFEKQFTNTQPDVKHLRIIIDLCNDLDRIANGRMPTAYISGVGDTKITENIPKEYKEKGVRPADVLFRFYQICSLLYKNKGEKTDFYAELSEPNKKKMDELTNALFILCYTASGAGSIGGFSVTDAEIKSAIKTVNKAILGYFGTGEFADLFNQLRAIAERPENIVLKAALDKNQLTAGLAVGGTKSEQQKIPR